MSLPISLTAISGITSSCVFPFALSFGIEKRTRAETINISSKGFTETNYREYNDLLDNPNYEVNNVKGGEKRDIYISSSSRKGIVLSGNKPPDYFEF